jgi:hypothetical protein
MKKLLLALIFLMLAGSVWANTTLLYDTFTGTNGNQIWNHTPDTNNTGHVYVGLNGLDNSTYAQIYSNFLSVNAGAGTDYNYSKAYIDLGVNTAGGTIVYKFLMIGDSYDGSHVLTPRIVFRASTTADSDGASVTGMGIYGSGTYAEGITIYAASVTINAWGSTLGSALLETAGSNLIYTAVEIDDFGNSFTVLANTSPSSNTFTAEKARFSVQSALNNSNSKVAFYYSAHVGFSGYGTGLNFNNLKVVQLQAATATPTFTATPTVTATPTISPTITPTATVTPIINYTLYHNDFSSTSPPDDWTDHTNSGNFIFQIVNKLGQILCTDDVNASLGYSIYNPGSTYQSYTYTFKIHSFQRSNWAAIEHLHWFVRYNSNDYIELLYIMWPITDPDYLKISIDGTSLQGADTWNYTLKSTVDAFEPGNIIDTLVWNDSNGLPNIKVYVNGLLVTQANCTAGHGTHLYSGSFGPGIYANEYPADVNFDYFNVNNGSYISTPTVTIKKSKGWRGWYWGW